MGALDIKRASLPVPQDGELNYCKSLRRQVINRYMHLTPSYGMDKGRFVGLEPIHCFGLTAGKIKAYTEQVLKAFC